MCECNAGYKLTEGKCVAVSCQTNAHFDASAGECVCDDNFVKVPNGSGFIVGFTCASCPEGATYDAEGKTCICSNGIYLSGKNICQPSL